MTALVVLRDKAIQPLLAAAQQTRPTRGAQNPTQLDMHYQTIRAGMQGVFHETSRMKIDNYFFGLCP
jgi:hypothetical protein